MRMNLLFIVSFIMATFVAVLVPSTSLSAAAARSAMSARIEPGFVHARPQVVENGSDLALFNFTGNDNVASPVAFGPDGSSYALVRGGLLKIAPNGSQTYVNNEAAILRDSANITPALSTNRYQQIVYADGFLWFSTYHGIYRERTDGSDGRYFQFGYETNGFNNANAMVAGADGIYFTAFVSSFSPLYAYPVIGRLGFKSFKLTLFMQAAGYGDATLVSTPDGHLDYLADENVQEASPSTHNVDFTSLFQLQPDGTSKILGTAPDCINTRNAVVALGAIYYVGYQQDASGNLIGSSLCRATLSGKIGPITPTVSGSSFGQIASDNSGNLWTNDLFGNGLYSYNIVSKQLVGPYEPSILNALVPFWLYVGPDQNVWCFGYYGSNQLFYGAYVRHKQVFTPTSASLNADTPSVEFFVSESLKSAPWTAVSMNPAVATVTPASSLVGRFHVSRAGVGSTAIAVTDAYGNVSYESVTSN